MSKFMVMSSRKLPKPNKSDRSNNPDKSDRSDLEDLYDLDLDDMMIDVPLLLDAPLPFVEAPLVSINSMTSLPPLPSLSLGILVPSPTSIPSYIPITGSRVEGKFPRIPDVDTYENRTIHSIDDLLFEIQSIHSHLTETADRLIYSFGRDLYPVIHRSSLQIIEDVENFIKAARKLRRLLRRVGFMQLRRYNRTIIITNLMTETENIYNTLCRIINSNYTNICNGTFFPFIVRGEMVLMKYIDKLDQLKRSTLKWVEKFFI